MRAQGPGNCSGSFAVAVRRPKLSHGLTGPGGIGLPHRASPRESLAPGSTAKIQGGPKWDLAEEDPLRLRHLPLQGEERDYAKASKLGYYESLHALSAAEDVEAHRRIASYPVAMDIAWYGHAGFRLRGREASVVMDPCSPETGFRLNRPNADIVTISRGHDAGHNWVEGVTLESAGPQRALDAPGEYEIKRVLATGVRTPGPDGSRNVAFVVTIDEVIVAHLGDLREMPDRAALEELQRADVLLLPCGGGAHLSPQAAAGIANAISSPMMIPMLYQPEAATEVATGLEPLSTFLREMGVTVDPPTDNHVNVTRSSVPAAPTIIPLLARGA